MYSRHIVLLAFLRYTQYPYSLLFGVGPLFTIFILNQEVIQDLTKGPLASALLWQKFLGHLASFVDLVPNCRLLMRPLQLHLLRYFTPLIDSQDKLVPLSPEIKVLCVAWASPSRLLEGKPFAAPPPSLVITTDASGQGWGGGRFFTLAVCQGFGRRRRPCIISILRN